MRQHPVGINRAGSRYFLSALALFILPTIALCDLSPEEWNFRYNTYNAPRQNCTNQEMKRNSLPPGWVKDLIADNCPSPFPKVDISALYRHALDTWDRYNGHECWCTSVKVKVQVWIENDMENPPTLTYGWTENTTVLCCLRKGTAASLISAWGTGSSKCCLPYPDPAACVRTWSNGFETCVPCP